jgi:competence protein ComEC
MRLLALALAWIAGLLIGLEFSLPPAALYMFLSACVPLALLLKARGRSIWPAVLTLALLLGLLRVQLQGSTAPSISLYNGVGTVQVDGVIVEDPEIRGRLVKLVVDGSLADQPDVEGKVLAWVMPSAELVHVRSEPYLRYGDRVALEGRLERPEPFDGFDYGEYLARQGIGSVMSYPHVTLLGEGLGNPASGAVYALRHRLARGLASSLPGNQAALAQALILGLRANVSEEVAEAFRRTGTSHILAISGLHVGVLLALTLGAAIWLLGRKRSLYLMLPLLTVWLYALLSGFSASVERASIMATAYLIALALGRQRSVLPSLALAAAAMAGLDPQALRDISFQLSATAVAGIALLTPPLSRLLRAFVARLLRGRLGEVLLGVGLAEAVVVCTAATIATLPLIAFHFQRVSVVGIPATLLLLPAVPFALVASLLAAVGGVIGGVLAQFTGWIAFVPLSYISGLVGLLGRLPGVSFSVPAVGGLLVWAFYGVGLAALLAPRLSRGLRRLLDRLRGRFIEAGVAGLPGGRRALPMLPLVLLAGLASLLWIAAATAPDGRLHVTFLAVGQGDSVLIETPSGRQVLVDGGPDPRQTVNLLGRALPFWDRSLDLVVLTHPQDDHLAGLVGVAMRYSVGKVLEGPNEADTALYQEWKEALDEKGIPVVRVLAGYLVPLEEGLTLEVLSPTSRPFYGPSAINENSVVLRLTWGEMGFLLTGDIEEQAEARLVERAAPLRSTVLKVGHHGSATSSSPEFLEAVAPRVAVVSVGADNRFGHPSPQVIDRLKSLVGDDGVYSTAKNGTIEFTTDGTRLWVKTGN